MFKAFLLFLCAVIIAGAGYSWYQNRDTAPVATTTPDIATTTDLIDPKPVTVPDSETTMTLSLGQSGTRQGVTVTPVELVSDSRCPREVQCVWAGMVQMRATVATATGTSTETFEIGTTVTTDGESVTLFAAEPYPTAGGTVDPLVYRFTFVVTERTDI